MHVSQAALRLTPSRSLVRAFAALTLLCQLLPGSLSAQTARRQLPRENVVDVPAIGDGLCLSNLFQTNMVLQRDKPMVIWGWAEPAERVQVTFGDSVAEAVAREDRLWKATLPALPASANPRTLTVTGQQKTLTLENVLVGDVWVLGGQSNMEFPLERIENGQLEIVSANFPNIRILTVPAADGPQRQAAFARLHEWSDWFNQHFRKGDWDLCTPESVRELSAIGYVFARRVHLATQVPIGIIDVSRGGTTVETWTPESVLRKMSSPQVQEVLTEWETRVAEWDPQADLERRVAAHRQRMANLREQGREVPASEEEPNDLRPGPAMDQNRPGNCYASMLGPLEGLHVKGVLFHQGYNNCFRGTQGAIMYRHVFPEMIRSWRSAFDDPQLPFGIISLCTEGAVQTLENYTEMMSNAGPYVREAQYQTFLELRQAGDANVGYVSTYDLQRRWYHPQLKIPAGERIARWALATQYGYDQQLQWKPPLLQEMQVEEGKIVLRFDDPVSAVDDGSPMLGFAIAGEDRVFHPATASHLISGQDAAGREQTDQQTVVLQSTLVTQPQHYRYAWGRSPLGNVQAGRNSDIPLATQRSDDWPLEDIPAGVLGETVPTLLSREQQRTVRAALQRIDLHRRRAEAEALLQSSAE